MTKPMKTTEILRSEHEIICDYLNHYLNWVDKTKNLTQESFQTMFDFFNEFVDDYHHYKEEEVLFKWMISEVPQLEHGPIEKMLEEHEKLRDTLDKFKTSVMLRRLEEACNILNEYATLNLAHIHKENLALFNRAESMSNGNEEIDMKMLGLISEHENLKKNIYNKQVSGLYRLKEN